MKEKKSSIRKDMKKLMKCMNYTLDKAEESNDEKSIYYDIYMLLGGDAWSNIADTCYKNFGHEYKISKKYPMGRCKLCGTIRRKDENKKRVRK
jgi:hypothetical protein